MRREVDLSRAQNIGRTVEIGPGDSIALGALLLKAGARRYIAYDRFRGDVFVWLSLERGAVSRVCLRDPSWFQWPLLEAVIENNIVADFPLCNKSFNCSYSGHDL